MIEVVDSGDGKGCRTVAKQDILQGERCALTVPLVVALSPDLRLARCGYCCVKVCSSRARVCESCGDAVFCDEECADLARHAEECELLKELRRCSETVLLAARVCRLPFKDRAIVGSLTTHEDKVSAGTRAKFLETASRLSDTLGNGVGRDQIFRILCVIDTNAHGVVDHTPPGELLVTSDDRFAVAKNGRLACGRHRRQISSALADCFGDDAGLASGAVVGIMLSPPLALLNHECTPSVYLACELRRREPPLVVTRAARPLCAGDELSCSYLALVGMTSAQRHQQLAEAYHFACRCRMCSPPTSRRLDDAFSAGAPSDAEVARCAVALDLIYDALLHNDISAAQFALSTAQHAIEPLVDTHRLKIQFLLAALVLESRCPGSTAVVSLAKRIFLIFERDPDLQSLAVDPVNLARVYCIASTLDSPAGPQVLDAWLSTAARLFETHLGPASTLARNARQLRTLLVFAQPAAAATDPPSPPPAPTTSRQKKPRTTAVANRQ